MDDEDVDVEALVRRTPPACVNSFHLTPSQSPEPLEYGVTTNWQLGCACGSDSGQLLGHRLDELNPTYKGDLFVGPLAFECSACGRVTELLDTAIHGYHAEVGKLEGGVGSAKLRGAGPRTRYACPGCQKTSFRMLVGFVYWDFDIIEDEPHLPAQEFFNEFLLYCTCVDCGHVSESTGFGKL